MSFGYLGGVGQRPAPPRYSALSDRIGSTEEAFLAGM